MPCIVIAGASGLVGRALAAALRAQGGEVHRLVRRPPSGPEEIYWDPARGTLDPAALNGVDAVVNLAGRSLTSDRWSVRALAQDRWTARTRQEIRESRLQATRLLVQTMARVSARPAVLVSASAVGYYGSRGDEVLTESSQSGCGFLADLAQAWEAEALRARDAGIRVVCARFGLVLGKRGGSLARLLPIFRLGLGGPLGSGRQWWSWVHLDDVVGAILTAIGDPALEGPVNVVAPMPVTNRDFALALGTALRRPAVVPAPAFALRLLLGTMADEMILASQRVLPVRLQQAGFGFRWPSLRPALLDLVGRIGERG
jgi:uncharacterized protein (TIGR01777 family)